MSKRLFLAIGLLLLGGLGVTWVERFDTRLHHLERGETISPARFQRLAHRLSLLQEELEGSEERLESYERDRRVARELQERLDRIEDEIESAREELLRQSGDLEAFEQRQNRQLVATLGSRLADLDHDLDARWEDVRRTLEATARLAQDSQATVDDLAKNIERTPDRSRLWGELMGPTVQLADESTVGSGVLLAPVQEEGSEEPVTYLLTAWHVCRDILDDPADLGQPIPVNVYSPEGGFEPGTATLVEHDTGIDVALLAMNGSRRYEHGARLASRRRLADVRTFDPIYAVGCPLGNDPIPTHGEIVDVRHEIDGQGYWMTSAPTYIGNSGGGIFDAESRELLGIFSKIYTHGNLRPTVVPHMGLATPLAVIYDWLEQVGHGDLIED